eukprot:Sspe_Gene.113622::Locus_98326_Transcript_2_4_Confidence_0.556_Length_403::g.113622::m.113622
MNPAIEPLERFFRTDDIQSRLSKFMHKELQVNVVYVDVDVTKEQPLDYYDGYKKYCALIEGLLEEFLSKSTEIDRDTLLSELAAIPDRCEQYVCAPYIDASLEYNHFLDLVNQYKE